MVVALATSMLVAGHGASRASAAVASPAIVYDSIGPSVPGDVSGVGFEATQSSELGDLVRLAPGGRLPQSVVVEMSSWGCQSGHWDSGDCTTTPGATFTHDVTLNLYAVDHGGASPAAGSLLLSRTSSFDISFRPSADPTNCPSAPGKWFSASDGACYNGLATPISFDLSSETTVLPSEVIWAVSYDTTHYGPAPIGEGAACFGVGGGCGYDSLSVGTDTLSGMPSAGLDVDPDGAFHDSETAGNYCDGGAGGTGMLREDTGYLCWIDLKPLATITTRTATITSTTNVVSQVNAHGWSFEQEAASGSGSFVTGPSLPSLGIGSAELTTSSSGRENLRTTGFGGTRLDAIAGLGYSSLRQTFDAGASRTISLELEADYDLTDASTAAQGRLVFEPSKTPGVAGTITGGSWFSWSPLEGRWWASASPGNGVCPQANPCDWLELVQAFPKAGIAGPAGALRLHIGPVSGGFTANADAFSLAVNDAAGNVTESIFDFENAPTVTILNAPSVTEGDSRLAYLKFQVAPSGPSAYPIQVTYATVAGTATSMKDFVPTTGTLSWPAMSTTTQVVKVAIKPDLSYEDDETLSLVLSSPVNALAGPPSTGTIVDNDLPPKIKAANASITEGNSLDKVLTMYVRLTIAAGKTVTVDYATQDDTATAGLDYVATSGTLTFLPGKTQRKVLITIKGDFDVEGNETFNLVLSNPVNAVFGEPVGTATIVDND